MENIYVYDKVDGIWVSEFNGVFDKMNGYTDATFTAKRFDSVEEAQKFIDDNDLVDCVVDAS